MSVRRGTPSDRALRVTLQRKVLASANMSQLVRTFEKAIKDAGLGTVLSAFSEATRKQARSGGEGVSAVQVSRIADQLAGMARGVQGTSRRAKRASRVALRAEPRQLRVRVTFTSIRRGRFGGYVTQGLIHEESGLHTHSEFSATIEESRQGEQEFWVKSFKSNREPEWLYERFLGWALNDDFAGVQDILEAESGGYRTERNGRPGVR